MRLARRVEFADSPRPATAAIATPGITCTRRRNAADVTILLTEARASRPHERPARSMCRPVTGQGRRSSFSRTIDLLLNSGMRSEGEVCRAANVEPQPPTASPPDRRDIGATLPQRCLNPPGNRHRTPSDNRCQPPPSTVIAVCRRAGAGVRWCQSVTGRKAASISARAISVRGQEDAGGAVSGGL